VDARIVRRYDGRVVPMKDPMGRPIYWFTISALEGAQAGTDRRAIERGWVSMTPLRLDLTDEKALSASRSKQPLDDDDAAAEQRPHRSDAERAVRKDKAETARTFAGETA
jgi:hypothetical protein